MTSFITVFLFSPQELKGGKAYTKVSASWLLTHASIPSSVNTCFPHRRGEFGARRA